MIKFTFINKTKKIEIEAKKEILNKIKKELDKKSKYKKTTRKIFLFLELIKNFKYIEKDKKNKKIYEIDFTGDILEIFKNKNF